MKKLFFISSILLVFGLTTLSFAQAQVESGKWNVSTSNTGYTLDENSGERSMTVDVSFAVPFDEKPDIVLGVTQVDGSTQTNIRYNVTTMSVSRDGFTIKISTWSDSKIYGIGGYWMAHANKSMKMHNNME
jgi:H-type lectin domain